MYDTFVENFLDQDNPISEIGQFRLYIQHEMEKRFLYIYNLDQQVCVLGENCSLMEIAIVTFAFDN